MGNLIGRYKKVLGILGLLAVVCAFTAAMAPDSFLRAANIENTVRWTALFGIISVGVSFVIMTGGIDLSIGSVVGLVGCVLAMCLHTTYTPEGLVEVRQVDAPTRTLHLNAGSVTVAAGDQISFLEQILTIEEVSDQSLRVAETVDTGTNTGSLFRVHQPVELSAEQPTPVFRGGAERRIRTLTLDGELSACRRGDRLTVIPDVGLSQEFSVHSVRLQDGRTEVDFFARPGQRVRSPKVVAIAGRSQRLPTGVAIIVALSVAVGIGLTHGLLITKGRLQPFVVTLCGLLIYRGLARYLTGDQEQGFGSEYPGFKQLAKGDFLQLLTGREFAFDIPMPFVYLAILAGVAAIFLNQTIFGRYILALGRNEEAARYSGIDTQRMVILSYVICSFCAGLAAILFALDLNSIQPSAHGEFYELYAIAAAVLGGCSLRGGEGSILGVVIAAAVMRVLNNAINLIDGIDTSLEYAIIGLVILMGVIVDELVRRLAARRSARRSHEATRQEPAGVDNSSA